MLKNILLYAGERKTTRNVPMHLSDTNQMPGHCESIAREDTGEGGVPARGPRPGDRSVGSSGGMGEQGQDKGRGVVCQNMRGDGVERKKL